MAEKQKKKYWIFTQNGGFMTSHERKKKLNDMYIQEI